MTFALRMVGYVLDDSTFFLCINFSCLLSGGDQLTMGSVFLYLDSIQRLKCKDVTAASTLTSVGYLCAALGLLKSKHALSSSTNLK